MEPSSKPTRLQIRISSENKANWNKIAKANGKNLSQWIRDQLNSFMAPLNQEETEDIKPFTHEG